MSLPTAVAARVGEALSALHRHPERTLLPWYRYTIYAALTATAPLPGLRVRAWLELAAVQRVLFCWRPQAWAASWPQPGELVALAEQILSGTANGTDVGIQLNRAAALADVVGEPNTSPAYCSWCVFEAALRALRSAWWYDQWHSTSATAHAAADAIGCTNDASMFAAIAVGGGTWAPVVASETSVGALDGRWNWQIPEAQLRRAVFWEWWLREALPAAWELGTRSAGHPVC